MISTQIASKLRIFSLSKKIEVIWGYSPFQIKLFGEAKLLRGCLQPTFRTQSFHKTQTF